MTDPIQRASEHFAQGLNCSQSVFSAFSEQLGIEENVALRLTSPFGGGVAHQGNVCGAVTGALLALGMQRGNTSAVGKDETYRIAEDFIQRFKELHGTIQCRELIGHDISSPDELQSAREQNVFKTICPGLVQDAVKLTTAMLDE